MTLFGYTLQFLRSRKGMTPEELSDALGIGATSLKNIENGYIVPEEETARRIADFFGVTVSYMTGSVELTLVSKEEKPTLEAPQRFVRLRPVTLPEKPTAPSLRHAATQEIILPLPAGDRSAYMAVQVTDNSMARYRALAGDYLVVRQDPLRIRNGDLVLLLTEDGRTVMRRFFAEADGVVLRSDDDDLLPPIRLADCDASLRLIGSVIQILLVSDTLFASRLAQNPPQMPEEILPPPEIKQQPGAGGIAPYMHEYVFHKEKKTPDETL